MTKRKGLLCILIIVFTTSKIFSIQNNDNYHEHKNSFRKLQDLSSDDGSKIKADTFLTEEEKMERKAGNCSTPAIEQFPEPLMDNEKRQNGGIIFHFLIAVYMFIGLAIICDDYFVPALEKLSESLHLPPDVAGATLMAAGSSGPELATSFIGVFVAKDDIGISGVIGSAVFNITLVIAVCALSAKLPVYLNWYSVVRDCLCYMISIFVLLLTITNGEISWIESLILLILYLLYCIGMAFNQKIEKFIVEKISVPKSWIEAQEYSLQLPLQEKTKYGDIEMDMDGGGISLEELQTPFNAKLPDPKVDNCNEQAPKNGKQNYFRLFFSKKVILLPIYAIARYTIPDCESVKWKYSYIGTFLISILWISFLSYIMVWMITVIGFTFGVPDSVMGLTFIAAGVSVPDALSGIAVVKDGHGNMAVSNAIGSNVFDILVCLGLPWFLNTAIVNPGTYVSVKSKGLFYSTFSLLSTIVFLIVASHFNGWKLDKKFGILLLIWYFIFMIFASMYELNFFGHANLPTCQSDY